MKEFLNETALQHVAQTLDGLLPDGTGFVVLMTAPVQDDNKVLQYFTNIKRESAVALLKEWLISAGHEEDWMKRIT